MNSVKKESLRNIRLQLNSILRMAESDEKTDKDSVIGYIKIRLNIITKELLSCTVHTDLTIRNLTISDESIRDFKIIQSIIENCQTLEYSIGMESIPSIIFNTTKCLSILDDYLKLIDIELRIGDLWKN
jgi:uncharacterized membrane protein